MHNRALHDTLAAFVEEAAWQLADEVSGGAEIPFELIDAGLWLERGAKGFEVIEVVVGSPAAAAGLKAGDVVTGVNGKAWSATTLSSVRNDLKAASGTKVRLRLASGGERVVTLRDLI